MSHALETTEPEPAPPHRHVTRVPLRWADMDAYGHVNNVAYLRYLQEARVDMLFLHAARRGAGDLSSGMLVAHHDVGYLAPLSFRRRPLTVETWVREVRNSTFTLAYDVLDVDDGERRVYASAVTTLVPYDLTAGRPRRLTGDEKAVLEGYHEPLEPAHGARHDAPPALDETVKTHVYECSVRFDDLDSYGHVNNVTFAEYMQEARVDFVQRHMFDAMAPHEGSVVAHQGIDYLAPVRFRTEPLQVHAWVTRIGGSSFDVAYEVRDGDDVHARGTSALVAYDVNLQQARTLTQAERDALEPFLQVPQ